MKPIRSRGFARASLIAGAIITGCLTPSLASATVTFSVDVSSPNGTIGNPTPGTLLVLDITLRSDGEGLNSMGASATGYDPNVVRFVSGTFTTHLFSAICLPLPTGCIGGILRAYPKTPAA